ncbi:MAG: MurR/RpiR family transcriptional regulator [Helicobacter sp.]|nr:MurR/RpiR family transcriptional regulator [Helicobacter sp.]
MNNLSASVLTKISSLYHALTPIQKHIADHILSANLLEPDVQNQFSTLASAAKSLEVGEASFVRFCQEIGFSGFSDFKKLLLEDIKSMDKSSLDLVSESIKKSDSPLIIAQKLKGLIFGVIDQSIELINENALKNASQAIIKTIGSGRVFAFGVGSSGALANYAKGKFMRIGLNIDSSSNNHFMYMQAALLGKKDVAIGISHSGQSHETIRALNLAKRSGATTIAITHGLKSKITNEANIVLLNGSKQTRLQGDSVATKIAQLFAIDVLYALMVQKLGQNAIKTKQKTLLAIDEIKEK